MTGVKHGTVRLEPHQETWREEAEQAIGLLRRLLDGTAVDIQHVGSAAIRGIHAKPILDIAVAVRSLEEIQPHAEDLKRYGILFRGEAVAGELLFVMERQGLRTHHIHVVVQNDRKWSDYLDFRDYLNAYPEKAAQYDACKQSLARQFPQNRPQYTAGKQQTIARLLAEARTWRQSAEQTGPSSCCRRP